MVTVFGILNLTEDSFFDESRRLDPAGAVTAAIEMLRVGSDVVDVGPAASHPDARPVSPADEIRRIAPLLDALSDQMHRVSIDSFQPETQRYALKRGVGYLNDIQGFPDPALLWDANKVSSLEIKCHPEQSGSGLVRPLEPPMIAACKAAIREEISKVTIEINDLRFQVRMTLYSHGSGVFRPFEGRCEALG